MKEARTPRTQPVQFEIGKFCITPGAGEKLTDVEILQALRRHAVGDWGILCQHDWDENKIALLEGHRLFSSYRSEWGETFWIITEADRSVTTVLLPEEY